MRRQGAKGPSGAPVHQLLMISLLAALVLTTCSHEGDNGGVAVPYNPLWVDVNTTNLHTVVTEDYIDLSGDAYCDSCPSGEVAFGYCPPTSLMQSSAINLTWSNITTGQGGDILYHGIVGSCSCLFSYCFTSYSHSWLVQGLPLEMGDNVIEITAYDASGNVATTLSRLRERPSRTSSSQMASPWTRSTMRSLSPVPAIPRSLCMHARPAGSRRRSGSSPEHPLDCFIQSA